MTKRAAGRCVAHDLQPLRLTQLRIPFAQFRYNAQAVYSGSDQIGVAAQESSVIFCKLAWLAAVNLKDAKQWHILSAEDENVGDCSDAVLSQK